MSDGPAIVVENLIKQFPGAARPVVDGCSFSVAPGELVVLLGPSGCGKTTLLKMVNRLYEPTAGRIIVNGVDAGQVPVAALRRQIGYVIQQTGLFPHMRIEDNIAVVPRLLRWPRARINDRIDELLALIGLPHDYRKRYPRQLSGGEQQRVGIARALAADPPVMLMDEPFGALDAITRTRLQDELLSLQSKVHKTILFVTHDVDEALRLADKVIVMRAGKLVQFDRPLKLLTRPADEFVTKLLSTGDPLRRLSLIEVGSIAAQLAHSSRGSGTAPCLKTTTDLRTALSLLLEGGEEQLPVVDEGGQIIGTLSFDTLRVAMQQLEQPVVDSHEQGR